MRHLLIGCCAALLSPALAQTRVLVVSVDGLDQRYLDDADSLGLKIPHLRRLTREGQWAQGVRGVVPTVTWPAHTTMITGVHSHVHGILANRRPKEEGGEYYWSVSLLKARSLLDALRAAGRTSAAITWPVTVDAPVTYNLPEYFVKRRGGDMDTRSIESRCVPPDLVRRITAMFPAFPQQWMEDRTRTMAAVYLLRTMQPDLILLHLVDHDSEAHDNGPFTREALATLEHSDELIGEMLRALPKDYRFVLVSDHGFEKVDRHVELTAPGVKTEGGYAIADSPQAAAWLRGRDGVGREVPRDEIARFAPPLAQAAAVFESALGVWFAPQTGTVQPGRHGHWPARYRAVYAEWGPGIRAGRLPEISQLDVAARLARLLNVPFTPGPK